MALESATNPVPAYLLAQIQRSGEESRRWVQRSLRADPEFPDALILHAAHLREDSRVEEALDLLEALARSHPRHAGVQRGLARALQNKDGEIKAPYFTALELNKYDYSYLREEACGALTCDVVEFYPRYEHSGYSRQVSWIDQVDFQVRKVAFFLDGRQIMAKTRPPYSIELDLGDAAAFHQLRVEGYDADGAVIASDDRRVNRGGQCRRASNPGNPEPGKIAADLVSSGDRRRR